MDQALTHEGSGRLELARASRRAGWSDSENKLLWETADEAQQQGLPLKAVFEQIARKTGRRPNSIRNYYYAQVRQHENAVHIEFSNTFRLEGVEHDKGSLAASGSV